MQNDDGYDCDRVPLSNKFMFYKIFTTYPELLKRLLEILLRMDISHIEPPQGEKSFDTDLGAKSIRLDIYTADGDHVYDVEMQNVEESDLPQRARYYQGLMDSSSLKKGEVYGNLRENIVIFLCMFDWYGKGLPFYTFENRCAEDVSIKMRDGTKKIFINAPAYDKILDRDQRDFLAYLVGSRPEGTFAKEIDRLIEKHSHDAQWRQGRMTFEMELVYAERRGLREGMEQGIEKGIEQGKAEGKNAAAVEHAAMMIESFAIPKEKVIEKLGLTANQVEQLEIMLSEKSRP